MSIGPVELKAVHSLCLVMLSVSVGPAFAADAHTVYFDMPPVVAAVPSAETSLVAVELRLSSMIASPQAPPIDQWLVRCQPRQNDVLIADYAPRTETASELNSPIRIKRSEEQSQSLGLAIDAHYTHLLHGNAGADRGKKNTETREFERHAPVQAVTAAGTINRGRGVYFKLRWTAQQVLEGEKVFLLTLRVPAGWRGGLIDVSVIAQSEYKILAGLDREIRTAGAADFVVAAYRAGDPEAARRASEMAEAEYTLRQAAQHYALSQNTKSLPSMLRQVAIKLDLEPEQPDARWLDQLLKGSTDPHWDKQLTKLPMPIRIAALDYVDARDQLDSLKPQPIAAAGTARVLVAKPAVEPVSPSTEQPE